MNNPDLKLRPVLYVGIDNGLNGAISGVNDAEEIVFSRPMPLNHERKYDLLELYALFSDLTLNYNVKVCLEKAHTLPKNGAKPNFTNGFNYGAINTILQILYISHEIVLANHWQKEIFQGQTVKDTKDASIKFCLNKWPTNNWKRTDKCTKYSDGMCDASGLALYCKRKQLHNGN